MGFEMLLREMKWSFSGVLLVCLMWVLLPSESSARPFRLGFLPDKGAKFGCGTCHVRVEGGGARNAFGEAWAKVAMKAGDKYTPELGRTDSDKDGFTNDQEFAEGTNPGDAKSKPGK